MEWGIKPERIHVIENLPHHPSRGSRESSKELIASAAEKTLVMAYFGQVNQWKGIDRIIAAFVAAYKDFPFIQLHLNGLSWEMLRSGLSHQDPCFSNVVRPIGSAQEGSIVLRGLYEPDELSGRMEDTDVVVMASRWYENAPMVIQESFSHSVPVIAPRLGGMAEKIQHEYNGYLFDPVSPSGLEVALRWFASNPAVLSTMKEQAGSSALMHQHVLDQHLHLYQQLLPA